MSLASARAAQARKPKVRKTPKPKRPQTPSPTDGSKRPAHRPPLPYTEELADRLCMLIATRERMTVIFDDPEMPGKTLFYEWMMERPDFAAKVARAREVRGQARVAHADDLVAGILAGKIEANAGRIAILHEQWAAGREAPRHYGDKIDLVSDGKALPQASTLDLARALLAALPALPLPIEVEATEAVPAEPRSDL